MAAEAYTANERARIRAALAGKPDFRVCFAGEVGSTQDELRRLLDGGLAPPCALLAARQTKGRGRLGRSWDQAPGLDLALSLALAPAGRYPDLLLPFLLAGALHRALADRFATGPRLRLKWPNDLLLDGRKLAGILIEGASPGLWICGIGCNVLRTSFPPELARLATSLALAGLDPEGPAEIAALFFEALSPLLTAAEAGDPEPALAAFHAGFGLLGREVLVHAEDRVLRGRLRRLEPQGLCLDGGRTFALGAVEAIEALEPSAEA